ncbi:MAG: UDP-N-acetylglucosamine 2-epimerase (non-hydrolyzing) [Planctomycetales bacterium]|nr:UDP-N-acetylglucosamine 2-epimerase (non-hydrolyzing) [Planctomycetales bacterium]
MLKPLIVFGTRPEAIKMAPVVMECRRRSHEIDPIVCLTGQHREMLQQVTDYFGIEHHRNLDVMQPDQTLASLTARCVEGIDRVLTETNPDCVVAQGDTTTVMATAVVAFYRRLPFVHIEAGLRTGNMYAPWPEEFNRRVASLVTALHCAPTERSAQNLRDERIDPASIHVTGNTVIDALLWAVERERQANSPWNDKYSFLGQDRIVLITGHRRENFGGGFEQICQAIAELAHKFSGVRFVYPVHLNPNVQRPVKSLLGNFENVHLVDPTPYPEFVWLMDRSHIILTDSGGVQEEAPSLKKPVLVMRETTERPEALDAGAVELVGTDATKIVARLSALLEDDQEYTRHQIDVNPYGDGQASRRIVDLMLQQNWNQ